MTQTLLDGTTRKPVLPTAEVEGDATSSTPTTPSGAGQQQQQQLPELPSPSSAAARSRADAADEGSRVGVIADSVPASISAAAATARGSFARRSSLRGPPSSSSLSSSSRALRNMSSPCGVFVDSHQHEVVASDGDEARRLAQRALRTLQLQKASMKERGSWPGGTYCV